MKWNHANFTSHKNGNKRIIEDIHPDALRVVFENDEIKQHMTSGTDWQNTIYSVDVAVQYSQGKPMRYKITQIYLDESIDQSE